MSTLPISVTPTNLCSPQHTNSKILTYTSKIITNTKRILDKHTDFVSSAGILVITTCLLAAKIFRNMPPLLSKMALIVYNFGGIIWLNVQVKDVIKNCRDLQQVVRDREWNALIETAAKVCYKGINLILTCTTFSASLFNACGLPHIMKAIYITTRPIALGSLVINIFSDIRDYCINKSLIKKFEKIENRPNAALKIKKIAACFLEKMQKQQNLSWSPSKAYPKESRLTNRIIRQLDSFTIDTFKESLSTKAESSKNVTEETFKLFYSLKDSLHNKQAFTEDYLSLTALGYVAMGICRAFPDTVIDMASRWTMSVLYTDELIRKKLFAADLAKTL